MEKFIKGVNLCSIIVFALYFISMFVVPWFSGDWNHVQSVWHSWQALNVGLLAFASSVIAFNISKYNSNKQREREFIAARSFLPHALSELTRYFESCVPALIEAWNRAENKQDKCKSALESRPPINPEAYKETFSRCITHADPEFAEYLALILRKLQIHQSRLESMFNQFSPQSISPASSLNIESYMYCIAELQALINQIFEYARGDGSFNNSPLSLENYGTAYSNLNIHVEDFNDLWGFTSRIYSNKNNT